MNRFLAILASLLIFAVTGQAQSTRRKAVHPARTVAAATAPVTNRVDTIVDTDAIGRMVRISGYKKTLASRVETLMLTNLSATDTIHAIDIDMDYHTLDGTQLNRRDVTFTIDIPPGETRHVSTPAWDRQQLFYHADTPPKRPTQRATPFTTNLRPHRLLLTRGEEATH